MDIAKIKALTEILCSGGLSAIEVGEGENRIRIERELSSKPVKSLPATQASAVAALPDLDEVADVPDKSVDYGNLIEIKSPLVGVYYASPSPDSDTFVSIGSMVKKGDVLCIIETMKLMNEIVAEQDGEIVDICLKNGDIAEFGQVLFKMV